MRTIRSYKLRLYGNLGKQAETYGIMLEYRAWLWHYLPRFYTKGEDYVESTQGLGWLANQAMKHARQMLKAGRNAGIATGERFSCPQQVPLTCEAVLEPNAESTFDYWVKVTTGPRLPAQTHRALKRALRKGGTLKKTCYIFESKGALYARVFVAHEKPEAVDSGRYLGVDVGVNAGVARSDGYIGKSLRPVLRRAQQKHAEQRRQGHLKSSRRTACKEQLDREAQRIISVCLSTGQSLAIERLNTLSNLTPTGSIGGWARIHLGIRCLELAELNGVTVRQVWPAGTSITCPQCGHRDKKNRVGTRFSCRACGTRGHTDRIAGGNIATRARVDYQRSVVEKGTLKTSRIRMVPCPSSGLGGVKK